MKYLLYIILLALIYKKIIKPFLNPYVLNAYIGKKGSGKSSIGVKRLLKFMKKGYICYTDLDCNIPGVRKVDFINLSKFRTANNSYCWIDEAGITYDNRDFKTGWNKGLTEYWKFQRHYKTIVDISSQATDYDLKLKNLVDNIYLVRKLGHFFTWLRPIGRQVHLIKSTAEADSRIAEDLYYRWIFSWRFVYLPKTWPYFNSFSAPYRDEIPYKTLPCPMLQDYHKGVPDPKPQFYYPYGKSLNINDFNYMKNNFSL